MKLIYLILLVFAGNFANAQNLKYSIIRDDNDYETFYDSHSRMEESPLSVIRVFQKQIKLLSYVKNSFVYKIKSTGDIDTYVLIINSQLIKQALILCYDSKTKKVTSKPIKINLFWSFNNESGFEFKMLNYPKIKIEDSEGKILIHLKERVHNGNSYDAIIHKIYEVKKNFNTELQLCYEELSRTFDNQFIYRFLEKGKIISYVKIGFDNKKIGEININLETFKIINKQCIETDYCDFLLTCSNQNEEDFLKKGYNGSY
jgi:hypothetical protein